jgi:hypothetical protein
MRGKLSSAQCSLHYPRAYPACLFQPQCDFPLIIKDAPIHCLGRRSKCLLSFPKWSSHCYPRAWHSIQLTNLLSKGLCRRSGTAVWPTTWELARFGCIWRLSSRIHRCNLHVGLRLYKDDHVHAFGVTLDVHLVNLE